ncbi:MAG: carbohydrate ABC transporter permease [Spirochaetales bacterium]|nr:carbohydrate ABC transporter permease [Spirochaetales bacterium]
MAKLNKRKERVKTLCYHTLVALLGIVMIYPILWLAGSSFKATDELFTRVSSIFPANPTFDHYISGWKGFGNISFTIFYKNTFIITGISTIAVVFSSAFIAYGFARLNFPFKKFWFACMLSTLMLPIQIQLIPQYLFFSHLGLVNSFTPVILPNFFGKAFYIFMIVQFIRGIPRTLDEAAEIDGCNRFRTFFTIIMPLCTPAMITAAIFAFYWTWGEFLMPLIYLNNPKLYTVSLALRSFADPSGMTNWGAIYAMSFLSLVPVFVIFILLQRYLIEGISTEGIKG